MAQRLRIIRRPYAVITAFAALAACAAPARQTVGLSEPAPSAGGLMTLGIVASVRPVSISDAQIGTLVGVNAVLAALSQQSLAPPVTGEEIVIRKDDGDTAAIFEQDQTPSIAAGDRVALIASSPAVIIRRN